MTERAMQKTLRQMCGPGGYYSKVADRLDELEADNERYASHFSDLSKRSSALIDQNTKLEADKAELRVILEDCAAELEEYDASPSTSKIAMLARQTIAKHKP